MIETPSSLRFLVGGTLWWSKNPSPKHRFSHADGWLSTRRIIKKIDEWMDEHMEHLRAGQRVKDVRIFTSKTILIVVTGNAIWKPCFRGGGGGGVAESRHVRTHSSPSDYEATGCSFSSNSLLLPQASFCAIQERSFRCPRLVSAGQARQPRCCDLSPINPHPKSCWIGHSWLDACAHLLAPAGIVGTVVQVA
jgi:hypothetical protein